MSVAAAFDRWVPATLAFDSPLQAVVVSLAIDLTPSADIGSLGTDAAYYRSILGSVGADGCAANYLRHVVEAHRSHP